MISEILDQSGYEVFTAGSGQQGLDFAVQMMPNLIILDIMMPGMDGWEVAKQIRAHAEMQNVPILAATALFRDGDLKRPTLHDFGHQMLVIIGSRAEESADRREQRRHCVTNRR